MFVQIVDNRQSVEMAQMTQPLEGIRVLDLTRAAAGPFCTMILGDFGADVVKVESASGGDLLRAFGPFHEGESTYFLSINRSKRSLAVDLRTPAGLALVQDMALQADVLVENFKPGVTEDMGLGYGQLCEKNPRLVYASISGFGADGPYGGWPGVDQIAQGMSGFMAVTGTPQSGPLRVGVPIGDLTAGMWTALGIFAALAQRQTTGQGQRVDTSLLGALLGLLCVQGQRYLSLGEVPGPAGNDHPVISPYGLVQAADGPLNICVATQEMWRKLCNILGLQGLIDHPDFADNTARARNRAELTARLNAVLGREKGAVWAQRLVEAGIPAGPVYQIDQVFNDPHVLAAGFLHTVKHSHIGPLRLVDIPARLQQAPQQRRPPPMLGENSIEVLKDFGISQSRIEGLLRDGYVQTWTGAEYVRS